MVFVSDIGPCYGCRGYNNYKIHHALITCFEMRYYMPYLGNL